MLLGILDNLLVPSSRVNNPEGRSSHLLRGGSPKSRSLCSKSITSA